MASTPPRSVCAVGRVSGGCRGRGLEVSGVEVPASERSLACAERIACIDCSSRMPQFGLGSDEEVGRENRVAVQEQRREALSLSHIRRHAGYCVCTG